MIETKRLLLRELTENDLESLSHVFMDQNNMQYYPYIFDEDKIKKWIFKNKERYQIFGFGLWAVILKETGEVIGDCGLTMQLINGEIKPEIGYHIRKDQQQKGYASEAAKASRDWTFENTPFNIIYSYMHDNNIASSSTAQAMGMHQVDTFENTKVYAISRSEWMMLKE